MDVSSSSDSDGLVDRLLGLDPTQPSTDDDLLDCDSEDEWFMDSDNDPDLDELVAAYKVRMPRHTSAYQREGNLLEKMRAGGAWDDLPPHQHDNKWLTTVRCTKPVFELLYQKCQHALQPTKAANPEMASHSKRECLIMCLYFLAHCQTLRTMEALFPCAFSTLCASVLHRNLPALEQVLIDDPATKTVRWPRDPQDIARIVAANILHSGLPGLGPIDGSCIAMKKPTATMANGNPDAYWSYKGFVSMLLLGVCTQDLQFIYVKSGIPGTIGDSGAWTDCSRKAECDAGLLRQFAYQVEVNGVLHTMHPFLVGDNVFSLCNYLLKMHELRANATAAERQQWEDEGWPAFNEAIKKLRRAIERHCQH